MKRTLLLLVALLPGCRAAPPAAEIVSVNGDNVVVRRGEMAPTLPAYQLAVDRCATVGRLAFPYTRAGGGPNAARMVEETYQCRGPQQGAGSGDGMAAPAPSGSRRGS
ncbi:hypothetical protein M0638_22860 [Roseomonas sp. NAR14]|uniref:Lipoprotein n=1 Tax=Roseomonas acroporae TaxID=2937791 RepID=A0A9X1YBR9_9PROT|nr:hypothetical protein [Roseomonas acroporae]MCK8787218.1 hypothetical protein [Roseomonas acroporae]